MGIPGEMASMREVRDSILDEFPFLIRHFVVKTSWSLDNFVEHIDD